MSESAPAAPVEPVEPKTGFAAHLETIARVDAAAPSAAELNNRIAKHDAIETKLSSPEVSLLNDAAEIRIYGTRDRAGKPTTEGFTEADGSPLRKPILGRIETIRQSFGLERKPRTGESKADFDKRIATDKSAANKKADTYNNDVERLLGKGLEFCQVELIMNRRDRWTAAEATKAKAQLKQDGVDTEARFQQDRVDARRLGVFQRSYEKQGYSAAEATKLAQERLDRLNKTKNEKIVGPDGRIAERAKPAKPHKVYNTELGRKKGGDQLGKVEKDGFKAEEDRLVGLIKREGVVTEAELAAALNEGVPTPASAPDTRTPAEIATAEAAAIERKKEIEKLNKALDEDRDMYAHISAGRGRRSVTIFGENSYTKKSQQKALEKYNKSRNDVLRAEMELAERDGGIDLDATLHTDEHGNNFTYRDIIIDAVALTDKQLLAQATYEARLRATGRYTFEDRKHYKVDGTEFPVKVDGKYVPGAKYDLARRVENEVEITGRFNKAKHKFYDWLGKDSDRLSAHTVKKGIALSAIGLPVGAAAGLAASVLIGPALAVAGAAAAGGFVANRASKAWMANKIAVNAATGNSINRARTRYDAVIAETYTYTDPSDPSTRLVPNLVSKNQNYASEVFGTTQENIKRNRKRQAAYMGTTALFGVVGAEVAQHLFGSNHLLSNNRTPDVTSLDEIHGNGEDVKWEKK